MFRMLDSARILPPFSSSGGSGAILPNLAPRSFIVVVVVVRSRSVVDSLSPLSIALLPLSLLRPALRPPPLSCRRRAAAIEFCNDSGGVGVRGGAHVRIVRSHEEEKRRGGDGREGVLQRQGVGGRLTCSVPAGVGCRKKGVVEWVSQ